MVFKSYIYVCVWGGGKYCAFDVKKLGQGRTKIGRKE